MVSKDTNKGVYLELDSFIDTRAYHLYKLSSYAFKKVFKNKLYSKRDSDSFEFINPDVFRKTYSERTKEYLLESKPCLMLSFITELLLEIRLRDLKDGGNGIINVCINTFPYKLSENEVENIKLGFITKLKQPIKLDVVYRSNEDMKVDWIRSNFSIMIKYDGIEWLHSKIVDRTIIKKPIPDVSIFVPDLILGKVAIKKENKREFLEDYSQNLSLFAKIDFLNVEWFSIPE